jgi:shikimate kinase
MLKVEDPKARIAALYAERDPLYREVADLAVDTRDLDAAGTAEALAVRIAGRWHAPVPGATS